MNTPEGEREREQIGHQTQIGPGQQIECQRAEQAESDEKRIGRSQNALRALIASHCRRSGLAAFLAAVAWSREAASCACASASVSDGMFSLYCTTRTWRCLSVPAVGASRTRANG